MEVPDYCHACGEWLIIMPQPFVWAGGLILAQSQSPSLETGAYRWDEAPWYTTAKGEPVHRAEWQGWGSTP